MRSAPQPEYLEEPPPPEEPPNYFPVAEPAAPKISVETIRGDAVAIEPVAWLWDGFLARGKMHLVAGMPEAGKTNLMVGLGAIVSRGGKWPDGSPCTTAGDVLIWSGEDAIADTLAPRFLAAGADMRRIHFVTVARENGKVVAFDPAKHVEALVARAKAIGNVALIGVDPILSAVAGDSHKSSETRRGLQPLVDCAGELGGALIGVTHFSKGTAGRTPLERVIGSQAFGALARIVFAAAVNDGDEDGPERIFVRAKSNIGPSGGGFGYSLRVASLPLPKGEAKASFVDWGEPLEGSAAALLATAEAAKGDEPDRALDTAKDVLRALLAHGPMPAKEALRELEVAGISKRTAERAKKELGVAVRRSGFGATGGFTWSLPAEGG